MICDDPYTRQLAGLGYCTIRLPRAKFDPLNLIQQSGFSKFRHFGQLQKVLPAPTAPIPILDRMSRVANLSGGRTQALKPEVGLDLLGGVVQVLGGSAVGLSAAYKNAKSIQFEFTDVLEDSVELADLDLYISEVEQPKGLVARRLAEEGDLYVVLATLSANKLLVRAEFDSGAEVKAGLPAVHGLVTIDLGVTGEQQHTWTVSYESSEPLRFAFKAVQVFPRSGGYTLKKHGKGSLVADKGSNDEEVGQLAIGKQLAEVDLEDAAPT